MSTRKARWPWGIGLDKRQARRVRRRSDRGCRCTELCSMGPTCPAGMLAGLAGSGCWRAGPPGAP